MNRCPTPEEVGRTLALDDDAQFAALMDHIERCEECQAVWETADGGDPLSAFASLNVEPLAPAYKPRAEAIPAAALERLKQAPVRLMRSSAIGGHDSAPAHESGRLQVRCPCCHEPLEVAIDTLLTDLTCAACGNQFSLVDQAAADDARPISAIGRFELTARLGFGSFGTVWKARDNELQRWVAIKLPRRGGMTREEQEEFFREARAAAQLRHPNIVSVYEIGRDGDNAYIVSDLVTGVTLSEWLAERRLSEREAAGLCLKIADAVQHAHAQGVIHRDLKPANILIDAAGEPHLTDFGLARREAGDMTMTLDGQVLGTPAYMAPEQARGDAHRADSRCDVYSLGVVLFQLLTGELPFRGNVQMILHQVIHNDAPSPRTLDGSVSKDLETITLKCLEKAPPRRYQSAGDLAAELRRCLAGQPIQARPVSWLERRWRWCKTHPAAAGLWLAIPVAALLLACVATFAAVQIDQERRKATDGLYHSLVREAAAQRTARLPGYRQSSWRLLQQAAGLDSRRVDLAELRQEAVRGMGDFVALQPITLPAAPSPAACLNVGDDERDLWLGFQDGAVARVDAASGKTELVGRIDGPVALVAFSPSRDRAACASGDGRVRRWRHERGEWRGEAAGSAGREVMALSFAEDQIIIVRRGEGRAVEIFQQGEDEPIQRIAPPSEVVCAAIDDRAASVAVGGAGGEITVWDLATAKEVVQAAPGVGRIQQVVFSANGNLVAVAGGDGFAFIDARSGERLGHNRESGCKAVALSPNGRLCAVSDPQGRVRLWSIVANAEFAKLALDSTTASLQFTTSVTLSFSGDNHWFCMTDGRTTRLWNLWETPETKTIEAHDGGVPCVAFSPDGQSLASVGKDGRCVISDLATGLPLEVIQPEGGGALQSVAFHPDGNLLALGGWGNGLELWDVRRRLKVAAPLARGEIWCTRFSDDGAHLAAAGKGGVWLWEVTGGKAAQGDESDAKIVLREVAHVENPITFFCSFGRNSHDLYWCNDCLMTIAPARARPHRFESVKTSAEVMPFGLRGARTALVISPAGKLEQHDLAGGRMRDVLRAGPSDARATGVAISPDGQWVAVKNKSTGLTLIDLDDDRTVFDLPGAATNSSVWFWTWSTRGGLLALGCADGRIYIWDIGQVAAQLAGLGLSQ